MRLPQISVVVPLHNAERYVDECIRALLAQRYPADRYEVILVDNNSGDGTRRIAERYPAARLLHEPQQGAYAARNCGVEAARGSVIAFTDPDCVPEPDWLGAIAGGLAPEERQIVLGKREYRLPSAGLQLLSDYESQMAAHVFSGGREDIYFGYTNNMAVRTSLFGQLGRFMALDRGADTVFVRKAVSERGCDAVAFVPEMRVCHLEIGGVRDFYRKRLIYGESNEGNRQLGSARPLRQSERLAVFRDTVRLRRYSPAEAVRLFALLSGGLLFYEAGRLRAHRKGRRYSPR